MDVATDNDVYKMWLVKINGTSIARISSNSTKTIVSEAKDCVVDFCSISDSSFMIPILTDLNLMPDVFFSVLMLQ